MIEFVITLCSSEHNVDPNAHSFRAGCHEMIESGRSLDDESEGRLWRSDAIHVVHVDFLDRLHKCRLADVEIFKELPSF